MCMKTQTRMTKCPDTRPGTYAKMHQWSGNRRKSIGLFGGKWTGKTIIGAMPGPKLAHRFIGLSIHRLSTEWSLDGPTSRWPDGPIISAFHYVLANKRG